MSTRRFQQACCAALFAAGCSADPGVECQRRAPGVAQQMAAMVATHQSGCATSADCTLFEPATTCVALCPEAVQSSSTEALKAQLSQLGEQACAGLRCTSAPSCAIVEAAVCWSGTCARGRADGGLLR